MIKNMKKIIEIIQSPITYLLALNFLGILLFIFLGFIAGEIILPGILSDYLSLGKLAGFLFLVLALTVIIAKEQEIDFKKTAENSVFKNLTFIIVFALTFVSLYKFGIKLNLFLTTISVTLFFLFKKYFLEDLNKN